MVLQIPTYGANTTIGALNRHSDTTYGVLSRQSFTVYEVATCLLTVFEMGDNLACLLHKHFYRLLCEQTIMQN